MSEPTTDAADAAAAATTAAPHQIETAEADAAAAAAAGSDEAGAASPMDAAAASAPIEAAAAALSITVAAAQSPARPALPPRTSSTHAALSPLSSVAHHPLALHIQTAEPAQTGAASASEGGEASAPASTTNAAAAAGAPSAGRAHPLSLTLPTSPPAIDASSSSSSHLLSLPPGATPSAPTPGAAGVSPSASPPPPPPPLFLDAFKGCPRLADYFLVLGRINDSDTPLVPMRKLSRSNSQTIQPISDVTLVQSKDPRDVPQDYSRCTDFAGRDVDCNPGMLKTSCFLAESRMPRRRGSQVIMPVTGLDIIWVDKKESPKPGFTQVAGNLNKGGLGHNVALCVERDPHKSPLIEIRIVAVPGGLAAIKEAQKWAASQSTSQQQPQQPDSPASLSGPVAFPPHIPNPFAALIPNEYLRLDRALNERKELFLAYKIAKRRAVEYMSYEPFLVDRYPETDHRDFPLETQGVSMLCFPRGMLLKPEPALPTFMTFVLTQASGQEVYGAALIFYEQMPADPQNLPGPRQNQQDSMSSAADRSPSPVGPPAAAASSVAPSSSGGAGVGAPSDALPVAYCPRCLCLLSHYPFYGLFQTFLNQLYRIAVSPSNMPLERFIGHFFHELPVPRAYIPNVTYSIGHAKVALSLPPACGLPFKNFSLLTLFRCLSVPNIVELFQHVLSEGKVVFYSNSYTTLTPVVEGIRLLLWPMRWQCVFIPILPTNLAYTVRAPVPFLIGLHRSFLDELKVPDDVLLVDLDRNRLSLPNNLYRPVALNPLTGLPETSGADGTHANPHGGNNSDFANHGGDHGGGASSHYSPNGTQMQSDSKLLYPLPEFMREWLTAELLDITTSPVDGVTLLYQAQDLSEEDLSLFHPPMFDSEANLDPSQVEQQEVRIRLTFLKVLIKLIGGYRKHIVLKMEESESFFDLDRLFDRAAFAKSFQTGGTGGGGGGECDSLYRFVRQLSDTQIFSDFILNRVTNATDFQGLFFFDYCVALQQEDASTGQPIAILPSASAASPHVHASSSVSAAVAAVASSAVVSAHPVVTPTAAQLRMHHHAKTPSEVTRETGKLERLKGQLKKRGGATGASPAQQMLSIAAMQDLMRSGSLTFQTLEAIKALPPSLIPMPRHWMSLCYSVPPPDSSALPEGRGPYEYENFPSLDPMKFGEYGPASAAGANAEAEIARNLASPASPNSPLRWLMAPHPSTTSGHATAAPPAPAPSPAKPSHTRGSVGAKKSPANRRGTELEALDAAIAANEHARGKILVSLYQHINSLQERIRLMNGNDRAALPHAAMIYELWFALFTSQCEKERARKRAMRRRRIAEGTYWPVSFLSPQSGHRNSVGAGPGGASASPDSSSSGSPAVSGRGSIGGGGGAFFDAHLSEAALRAEEHRECLSDLLLLFIELHSMVSKGGVLPTERLLEDLSLFALKMNLVREFQEIYRLFSTSVPHLSTRFFNQLIRIGITTPIRNPEESLGSAAAAAAASSEESKAMQRKIASMLPAAPPTPDDPLTQLMRAKSQQLSTFDNLSSPLTAPPLPPEEVPSYSYPLSVVTSARCGRCQYELGGEDILVGWMLHADRLSTSCPLCESHVTPYLLVRLHDQAHELRVEYMRPSAIRSTLHSLALLRRDPDVDPSLSYGNPDAGNGCAPAASAHSGGGHAVRAEVGRSEYLTSIRSSSLLFWNTFWSFACRGPKSRGGFGQLPWHFLFASDDSDSVLSRVQQSYTSDCGPYRPWRVTADLAHPSAGGGGIGVGSESAGSSSSVNSPFQSPYLLGQSLGARGRGLSWETSSGSQDVRAAIGETLQAFGASASSNAQEPLALVAATAAAAAATQPRKGSILRHTGDGALRVSVPTVSRKHSTGGATSLLNTLLEPAEGSNAPGSARVKFCDSDDESSRRNSSAGVGFKLEVPPHMVRDSSPDLDALDEAAAHQRRSSLAFSNVRYIMQNVKSRPVQQAVRTILRARLARRGWSVEERAEDEPHFQASMYQQLAQLLPDPVDPLGFCAEYKAALASIDASMEQHRKQIETLEAASSNILSAVLGGGSAGDKSKDSAAAAAQAGAVHAPLKTEDAAALEIKRRKKEAVSAALEECVQMRSEILPQDAPPTAASIQLLMSVRRVFGFELHKSIVRAQVLQLTQHQRSFSFTDSGAAAGVLAGKQLALSGGGGGLAVYGSILDEILVNDIPSLEDVLTQVSHNPAYTLQGFMRFCLKYRTQSEINAAAASGSAALPEAPSTAVAIANGAAASAPTSIALSYVEFWSAVRRWRVRYERNDRNRSLSLITKGPSGELYDSVYESAKSIYTRFLLTPMEAEMAAAGAAGGGGGGKNEIRMLPAAAGASIVDSMGMAHARRKSSLTSIAETSPQAAQSEGGSGDAASSSTALSVSVSTPSAASGSSSVIPASSHFSVNPTPMSSGGHVTTVRGLILPRPLHENIRRTLHDLKLDTVAASVDPLLGTSVPSLSSHMTVPKFLFDDAAQVTLNWLKKHCFSAFVAEIKAEEDDEEDRAMEAAAEHKKAAEVEAAKAAQHAAAASSSEAAAHAAIASHSPQPHAHHSASASTLAAPTHNADGSLRTPPPIPPRPLRADGTHSGSSSTVNTPVAGARPSPASVAAVATPLHLPLSKLSLTDASSSGVDPVDSDASKAAVSPQASAASARLMGLDPLAHTTHSPAAAAAPSVVRVSPPSAPAAAPAAPLPLLHNVSDVSARVAKSGTEHVPDYSSASPPAEH